MRVVKTSKDGIAYLVGILKAKTKTITRVVLWKIPHKSGVEDVCLKIGRYNKNDFLVEELENQTPKSELTLEDDEFQNLLKFIRENYEPFRLGVREYIPLDEQFDHRSIVHLKAVFDNPEKQKLLDFIIENDILPDDIVSGLQQRLRARAIKEFEEMLDKNLVEHEWQNWFKNNDWVLGSDFVRILDEREIDTEHIVDYLMQAYDGFLDIIEIKRPQGNLKFWSDAKDHGNYVPSHDLTEAIIQSLRYIYEVEREANSVKFLQRVENVKTVKPRSILIFGRSQNWNDLQKESYRILNASFHNLSILTYDHVLDRAKRILGVEIDDDDVPIYGPLHGK